MKLVVHGKCYGFMKFACMIAVFSYPLVNLPLPGNAPLQYETAIDNYTIPLGLAQLESADRKVADTDPKRPRWVCIMYGVCRMSIAICGGGDSNA